MYLNPNWRILTVGDGDLSFSKAIAEHIKPATLLASTYDDANTLVSKYSDNALAALRQLHVPTLTEFDVTQPTSWQRLGEQQFDVVIFQFPLVPAFVGAAAFKAHTQSSSMNVLNRALLYQYLHYASHYALDKNGPMLCYITSKDVKPYREWNIEGSINQGLTCQYLGQMPFDITHFPGYKIRNVDRDKHVKDTSGITYVFSEKTHHPLGNTLKKPAYLTDKHCPLCRVGPFMAQEDEHKHMLSKKHNQMLKFEQQWQAWLAQHNDQEQV
ncbi:class I SAM-dependent methyltransferase [Pseudoalteromonas mariniglutinosa]|uniref:class I SAM-dependent methyltransferase n=1 Tax=Pseudoalteromonas mariniglutinosa TaxID=206042 RepID=UPI00384DB25F